MSNLSIFTLTDTHGIWPVIPRNTDLVLFGGDLINGASLDVDAMLDEDSLALMWRRRAAGLPAGLDLSKVIAVRGNHDVADPLRFFTNADDLSDGRLRRLSNGLWIGGIGWHGERHFELPTEGDLLARADLLRRQVQRQMMPSDRLILLTHYPPRVPGLLPISMADGTYTCIAELIEELRPQAVICGHVHDWFGLRAEWHHPAGPSTDIIFPGPVGMPLNISDGLCQSKT